MRRREYDILIPMAEVARILGVSRQRVFQLVGNDALPRPLSVGDGAYRKRLWSRRAIVAWAKKRG